MEIRNSTAEDLEVRRGRANKYPWDEWLQHAKTVKLVEGEDFTCRANSIRQQAYNRASDMHGTITTKMYTDSEERRVVELTFQYDERYLQRHPEKVSWYNPSEDEDLGPIEQEEKEDDETPEFEESGTYGRDSIPQEAGKWGPPRS